MSLRSHVAELWELGDTVSGFMAAVTNPHNHLQIQRAKVSTHMNSQSLALTREIRIYTNLKGDTKWNKILPPNSFSFIQKYLFD